MEVRPVVGPRQTAHGRDPRTGGHADRSFGSPHGNQPGAGRALAAGGAHGHRSGCTGRAARLLPVLAPDHGTEHGRRAAAGGSAARARPAGAAGARAHRLAGRTGHPPATGSRAGTGASGA